MLRKSLIALALALGLLAAGSAPAGAHAHVVDADPKDGAELATMPSTVTLTFSQDVTEVDAAAFNPDGSEMAAPQVLAEDERLTVHLVGGTQKGTYTVNYRVIAVDGHPISGSTTFSVAAGQEVTQRVPAPAASAETGSSHLWWVILAAIIGGALAVGPLLRRRRAAD